MKRNFFTGLIALLPFIVTYIVIVFCIGLITAPFEHIVSFLLERTHLFENGLAIFTREQIIHFLSKLCIILAIICSIFIVGFFAAQYVFEPWLHFIDNILRKIPIVRSVYAPAKQLVHTFFEPPVDSATRQTLLIPYPSANQFTMAIATGEFTFDGKPYFSVFVPSTPNSTNGYLCSFPKESVQVLDLPADEALKYIMSLSSTKPIAVKD